MSKKTIAIIEANGDRGSAIARKLAHTGNRLLFFAHEPGQLTSLVKTIRAQAPNANIASVYCPADASWEADIIVSTIALDENEEIKTKIASFSNRKILIDASGNNNTVTVAGAIEKTKELQRLLPAVKIVKLFNISFIDHEVNTQGLIVGNDKESLVVVDKLWKEGTQDKLQLVDYSNFLEKIS